MKGKNMKITLKQNWKSKKKKDKVRALCTLSVGDVIGVNVKIIKSKKGYFLAFPSYYSENKDEYISTAFPMTKAANKNFDKLLKKFLKSGKKSCSLIIDEDEIDEDEDEIDEDEDEIDEDEDEIDEDEDEDEEDDDLPF